METKVKFKSPTSDEVLRSIRDEQPLHYNLKIQSFSLMEGAVAGSKTGRYESQNFIVGGYQWKLALYPIGDEKRKGFHHISLYLVSVDDSILATTLKVNVTFTFLVYDHLRDKYLSMQDGKVRCFHAHKTEWGFPKLLSLDVFNDVSNGFLVDDCCVFGVDIFVMKCDAKGESLSLIKEPLNNKFTWKIYHFHLDKSFHESDSFKVGDYWWKIKLYPRGCSEAMIGFSSLYLILLNGSKQHPKDGQVYVNYEMSILNQSGVALEEHTYKRWFEFGVDYHWGTPNFILLSDLKAKCDYIRDRYVNVEVKINVVSKLERFA